MITWKWLKAVIIQKQVYPQYSEDDTYYKIKLFDGQAYIDECQINKLIELEDKEDFENNFKSLSNQPLTSSVSVSNTPNVFSSSKNDHSMQPWGAKKGRFVASDRACTITLSNKSVDGLTFTYSMGLSPLDPRVGDYVFQDNFCKRSWITAVDLENHTITFDNEIVKPTLDEGTGHYSQGYWLGVDVPDWHNPMYLWGVLLKFYFSSGLTSHDGKDDFIELSIVDANDYFKDDTFCNSIFGVSAAEASPYLIAMGFEDNGEYGHWTKYYDESWVCTIDGKIIVTPDGAPGELMSHLETRISIFTSKKDSTVTECFLDYLVTAKE